MRSDKSIKKLIQSQEIKTTPPMRDKILAGAFQELDKKAEQISAARPSPFFGSRLAQLAAAACIVLAIYFTAYYIGRPVDVCSVAIARVAENIDNVHTFTYRYYQQILNGRVHPADQTETIFYVSPDHGIRLGTYVDGKTEMQTFILPAEKVKITVLPEEKQYTCDELPEQTYEKVQREKDPRRLIRRFLSSDYTDLGCREIDGILSHGIEVSNPGFLQDSMSHVIGRLWVNVKTQLPMRMELEGTDKVTSKRVRIVTDEFRWDAGLQKDDFGPFIPEDYVLSEQETDP